MRKRRRYRAMLGEAAGAGPEAAAPDAGMPVTPAAPQEAGAKQAAETVKAASAQFESVTAAFGRIASAAAGRSREEELAQKQLDKTGELVAETKAAKEATNAVREAVIKIGDEIVGTAPDPFAQFA